MREEAVVEPGVHFEEMGLPTVQKTVECSVRFSAGDLERLLCRAVGAPDSAKITYYLDTEDGEPVKMLRAEATWRSDR